MNENNDRQLTTLSKADTTEDIADFWDSHSLADYWDQTHEAEFEVSARRRRRVTPDPELWPKIEVQARTRGILPETLINIWLLERLQNCTSA